MAADELVCVGCGCGCGVWTAMSDDDFMYDDDDGYDFEYEEADEEADEFVGVENKYYNAKALRDDFAEAMREFQAVVGEEGEPGDWGFRATKQMIKLCLREGKHADVLAYYEKMLVFVRTSAVTRNYAEKSINNMLDRVSNSADYNFTMKFYELTLATLKETNNDRLWLRTGLRLAKLLLDQEKYDALKAQLEDLKKVCMDEDGNVILERGTQLLEIYAMYLSMYTALDKAKELKDVFTQCIAIKSAIPHPRVMGLIRESGGKMYMNEHNWAEARSNFYDAFKNYDEAGSPRRIETLKYLVLASMLSESEINPLASPEAKSYQNHPEIAHMTSLVRAYEKQDVSTFEDILDKNQRSIMGDEFIARYMDDLRRTIRMQALVTTVVPYTRIRISALSGKLRIKEPVVEELLVALILDQRLDAKIDQENGILILQQETADHSQYDSLCSWATNIESLLFSSVGILG
ncbi:PCI-domain-containing protein [Martensiomyces pterosporus]|nr:PCI-domain-containing protein [Martensiomyces pterosporus]